MSTLSTANSSHSITTNLQYDYPPGPGNLFGPTLTSVDIISWNTRIHKLIQNHHFSEAHNLFDKMPAKDIASYNTILSSLNKTKNPEEAYRLYLELERAGLNPNEYTISILLTAVLKTVFNSLVPQIHARGICLALNASVFVGSALMKAYANSGDLIGLRKVFDEITTKDVTSWNALISGYMELGCMEDAKKVFDEMSEKNVVSRTILVNGYILNNRINRARSVFNKMPEKNVVAWTTMISGYVQNGKFYDALKVFLLMVISGTRPNNYTFSKVLDACAGCSFYLVGQQVHSTIIKDGIPHDVVLSTSLADMYAKCGDIDAAFYVFENTLKKNLASWNAMIGGFARNGLGERALAEFHRMREHGVWPNGVTFVNVLSACGHGGLVEEGEMIFDLMERKYGVKREVEHYACMVDLYGRAGELVEAEELIREMPFEADEVVWGALLGACGLHSSLKLGEFAAKGISRLKENHPAIYSTLLKIHGENGTWNTVIELRKIMNKNRVDKQKAASRIESPVAQRTVKLL